MFCTVCGHQLTETDKFCPQCGGQTDKTVPPEAAPSFSNKKLVRPMHKKSIGGVCAGFADYLDVDLTLMRIVWLCAAIFTGGIGFVAFHPGQALTLYYGMLAASGLLLAAYTLIAPGVGQATPRAVGLAFIVAQCFLLARLWLRLGLIAGQVVLFRANLVVEPEAPTT